MTVRHSFQKITRICDHQRLAINAPGHISIQGNYNLLKLTNQRSTFVTGDSNTIIYHGTGCLIIDGNRNRISATCPTSRIHLKGSHNLVQFAGSILSMKDDGLNNVFEKLPPRKSIEVPPPMYPKNQLNMIPERDNDQYARYNGGYRAQQPQRGYVIPNSFHIGPGYQRQRAQTVGNVSEHTLTRPNKRMRTSRSRGMTLPGMTSPIVLQPVTSKPKPINSTGKQLPLARISQCESGMFECSICQENFTTNDSVVTFPCFHRFHADCAKQWLYIKHSCPVCRQEI